jgi:hypothetical protein
MHRTTAAQVIASFVLAAFGEQPPPDSKKRD